MTNAILCWLIPVFIIALCGGMYFLITWMTEKEYRDLVVKEKREYQARLKKWKKGKKFTKNGVPIPRPRRMWASRY